MQKYFAIFFKCDSDWCVRFPDLDGIHTFGKTLEEAIDAASDALSGMLVVGRKGKDYKAPSSFDDISAQAKEAELVFPVFPSESDMEAYKPKKRVNIMVPVDLLEQADKHARGLNIDRSRFFCESVQKALGA